MAQKAQTHRTNAIIGSWEVHAPDAPFPWHVMTFTPYGTMSQSNPHEGNVAESDSSGQGVWESRSGDGGSEFFGKFVEFKAERGTGIYIGKGVIVLRCTVKGDTLDGTSAAFRYDAAGVLIRGPLLSPIHGQRIRLSRVDIKAVQ